MLVTIIVALVITGFVIILAVLPAASDRAGSRSSPTTVVGPSDPTPYGSASTAVDDSLGCEGIRLEPGDDPQVQLQSQPAGQAFCFSAGVHRLARPLTPKDQQRLVGEPGAILSGAQMVTDWTQRDGAWTARGYLPTDPFVHGECVGGYRGCGYAEAVFYNNRQLWRVDTRDELAAGRFFEDYKANAIWIADDPIGQIVEVARTEAAIKGKAKDVLIKGLTIEKFANPAQFGAVQAQGSGWQIQNNDVRLNHGHGVFSGSANGEIVGNHLHHNGQLGLGGDADYGVVTDNEIDNNNTAGFDTLWEAGGMKWFEGTGLKVFDNDVHHNNGNGLWTDIRNINTMYDGNFVHNNLGHGIFHEISYKATIRNNRVSDNGHGEPLSGWGGAGIRVSSSPNVEIYNNILIGNANGIMLVEQRRTDSPSPRGPHELDNIYVHDNEVSMTQNVTGMVNDTGDNSLYHRNIRFDHNTYRLKSLDGEYFAWAGDDINREAWVRRFGHDTSGRFLIN